MFLHLKDSGRSICEALRNLSKIGHEPVWQRPWVRQVVNKSLNTLDDCRNPK